MVPINAGSLTIPDPSAPGGKRTLKVGPYWISRTEVTWDAYDGFYLSVDPPAKPGAKADAISRPSKSYYPPDRGFGHAGYPAISVASLGALNFCKWLSRETGHRYRLATEAEWEYAARAGDTTVGPLPKEKLEEIAWFWENSDDTSHPVAKKKPNAFGLYDTLGNVGEWILGADGKPVLAGGSWNDKAENVHYGTRMPYSPAWQATDPQHPKSQWWLADGPFVGLRIVRVP